MDLHKEWLQIKTRSNHLMEAYFVRPKQLKEGLPGILVIHDLYGMSEHIQDVAERLARSNYFVIAADLYSKNRPPELQQHRLDRLRSLFNTMPTDVWWKAEERESYIDQAEDGEQLRETIRALPTAIYYGPQPERYAAMEEDGKALLDELKRLGAANVGSVGFCMGGTLTYQLASSYPSLGAAVAFYGNAPKAEKIETIDCPVLGLYGELDKALMDQLPELTANMERFGKDFHYVVYKNTDHAFFEDQRVSFNPDAARDAWARTLSFFNRYLPEKTDVLTEGSSRF